MKIIGRSGGGVSGGQPSGLRRSEPGSGPKTYGADCTRWDVINRGMLFVGTLLLCFVPFLIVVSALADRPLVTTLARYTGLNREAAADVGHLFASSAAIASAVAGTTSMVFFVLGGIATATALQEICEQAFDMPHRGIKDIPHRLAWLAMLMGTSLLTGAFPPVTGDEPPYRQLIEGYCRFLRDDRGLAETTIANYRTAWNHLATALSGFYRWLDLSGNGGAHLVSAVPAHHTHAPCDERGRFCHRQVLEAHGLVGSQVAVKAGRLRGGGSQRQRLPEGRPRRN